MMYESDMAFEKVVREVLTASICSAAPEIRLLDYKTVGDIIISREGAGISA
jgi:hypothetical protein